MTNQSKLTDSQKRALGITTLAAVIFACWFLRGFFIIIVFAAVIAYLFNPIHQRISRRKISANSAAALTLIVSILVVLIPLILVSVIAVTQLRSVASDITEFLKTLDINTVSAKAADMVNQFLEKLPGDLYVTQEGLVNTITQAFQSIGSYIINVFTGVAGSVAGVFTSLLIYIYVSFSFIKNGPKLIEMMSEINPLGRDVSDLYFSRAAAMVRGAVQGQFIIALAQGFLSALTFAIVGYSNLFFVLFIIFTAFSIIPLGAGILTIPLGMLMIASGNITAGLVVIGQHLLISTNIDNILRPILVPKEARLDSALMLISVFAGLGLWGFAGIIIGPTIMILIVTTIQVYLEVFRDGQSSGHKKFWQLRK